MKPEHNCYIKALDLPAGVRTVTRRWRCPTCGQYWTVVHTGGSYAARRSFAFFPNLKLWRWRSRAKRQIAAENYEKGKP